MIERWRNRLVEDGFEVGLMVLVAVVALVIGIAIIAGYGVSPSRGVSAFISGAFGTQINLASTISKMVPLSLVALAWIVAFRAGRLHIGFPGGILIGGLLASFVGLKVSLPLGVHLPLTIIAGMVGGMLWMGVAAWLWNKRGVNEILSTLLLNLVAAQIVIWWVTHPLHDATSSLPETAPLPESARYPSLIEHTDLHWDVVLIPVAVIFVAYMLTRTTWGFRVRVSGANEGVARHAGFSPKRIGIQAMLFSGALSGLAGASLVLASINTRVGESFEAGYGFEGIAVALLASNSPWGVIPASLLFGALNQGGQVLAATVDISSSLVEVIQGIVIMLVLAAVTFLSFTRARRHARALARHTTPSPPAKECLNELEQVQ